MKRKIKVERLPKILEICAIDITAKTLLLPLINKLKEEGYVVEIVCSKGEKAKALERKGYVFRFTNIDRKINPISNIKSILELYRIMKKGKYDIVHVHTPVASVLGRIAAKLAGIPIIIYTAHGFYFDDNMPKIIYKIFVIIEKLMGKFFTDYIFTQSYEDYKNVIKFGVIGKEKIACISNGVDVNKFNFENVNIDIIEFKKNIGLPINSRILCFVGRLIKVKGILDLLNAFKNLIKDYNNLYLIIVGDKYLHERDLDTKQKIDYFLQDNDKLKNHILLTGYRDDIPELLKISDIFILPSHRGEGMPRSILEAMAMGKPVITTNIRGCREEVIDGKTGFLINVNAPHEIYRSIKKLLDNNDLIKRFGINGRKRVEKLFNEEKVLEIELEIINSLINTSKLKSIKMNNSFKS